MIMQSPGGGGAAVQVCIAGNMGSGKTTLAHLIAHAFNFTYLPEPVGRGYLLDLFHCPDRWAFEAVLAFFARKAVSLANAHANNANVVVDRSLHEDSRIFARMFYQMGGMDERAYESYTLAVDLILRFVPPPTLILFCRCSAAVCEARVDKRGKRPFEELFPPGHFLRVERLYYDWLREYYESPVYVVDTERVNYLNISTQQAVLDEIGILLEFVSPVPVLKPLSLFRNLRDAEEIFPPDSPGRDC
jgi:deoxyadenosine/deoxycytidine kinase